MDKRVTNVFNGFTERWNLLSFGQKIMLGTMVLALAISSFFLFQQANNDYDVLYSNMSLPDAAATVAKLKEMKEPFKLSDGGTTILVPRAQKNQLVLDTANELTGENTINLGKIPPVVQGDVQKEWIKKLNTQAISDVLKGIQGIRNAQVIISQPEKSVFTENEDVVKASVMLAVEPGFRLREEQVKTIKNLVAHAVPGLMMENVAISDNSGNPLEGPAGGMTINGNTEADLRQRNYEDKIKNKVLAILTPVVGKENAVVSVSAMLNFDQTEAEIHRVIPTGGTAEAPTGLAVSNQTQVEEYAGGKKPEGGAAGTESNTPTYQGPAEGGKDQNYKSTKTTTNYVNSEEHKKVVYAAGNVERLTVAVVLNKVLTAKETDEIRDLVANAAGIDEARGDSVDIKGFQFSAPPADKEKELAAASKSAQEQAFYIQLASVGAVVLLGLAGLFIFYSLFKKPAEGELVEEAEDYSYMEEPLQPLLEEMPIPVIEARLDPEIEHMRESINNMVAEDPSEAARVLVTYMKEI